LPLAERPINATNRSAHKALDDRLDIILAPEKRERPRVCERFLAGN
jgi:hypothetical protein